jgi:NAD(P)-dependent dehydrogenase (short-subunit alcohol dehydrogenase family)
MKDKVALVTGGANGIGKATARLLLARGVHVAIADIAAADLADTVAELRTMGPQVLPLPVDLGDLSRAAGLVDATVAALGRLDHLVNCAAILGGTASLLDIQLTDWETTFRVNLTAPMLLMQAFARHAIGRGDGGCIVNLTSASAFRAQHSKPGYGSAKAGLTGLTRILAAQLAEHDINVNAVAPGITNTPGAGHKRNVDYAAMRAKVSEGPQANFFKRVSEPDDVAETVVFLCSPASRQITGQTIHVSAGAVTP